MENEKTKKKSEDEAKTPAKNNTAIKNHKRLIRFKIEAVVKKPNHSASQECKFPARRKGNITKVFKPSNSVTSTNAGKLEDYRHLRLGKDSNSFANELGCLTQGILDIEGTNYTRFINNKDVFKKKSSAHPNSVLEKASEGEDHRTCMTIGSKVLDY